MSLVRTSFRAHLACAVSAHLKSWAKVKIRLICCRSFRQRRIRSAAPEFDPTIPHRLPGEHLPPLANLSALPPPKKTPNHVHNARVVYTQLAKEVAADEGTEIETEIRCIVELTNGVLTNRSDIFTIVFESLTCRQRLRPSAARDIAGTTPYSRLMVLCEIHAD